MSASTASEVAKQLVVLKRKTAKGAKARSVLVALGIRLDGKRETIDFQKAGSESQCAWEAFLNALYQRGLKGEGLKLIVVDGGKGLREFRLTIKDRIAFPNSTRYYPETRY